MIETTREKENGREMLIICLNQIGKEKREKKENKATILITDISSCLHISIPSMYNITNNHQQ